MLFMELTNYKFYTDLVRLNWIVWWTVGGSGQTTQSVECWPFQHHGRFWPRRMSGPAHPLFRFCSCLLVPPFTLSLSLPLPLNRPSPTSRPIGNLFFLIFTSEVLTLTNVQDNEGCGVSSHTKIDHEMPLTLKTMHTTFTCWEKDHPNFIGIFANSEKKKIPLMEKEMSMNKHIKSISTPESRTSRITHYNQGSSKHIS